MGTYTVHSDKKIDEKIQSDMDIICDELVKHLTPVSILLTGSFGRGEGSVVVNDGRILPLNDYDIMVIVKEQVPERMLKTIEGNIHDRLGFPRPESRQYRFSEFIITVFQTTPENIMSYANVGSYEIKTGGRLLWGKDIRDTITLTINDIPVASGFQFLFHKAIQLSASFSFGYLKEPPRGTKKTELIYNCGKAYIVMGTALSILGGFYRPTYMERSRIFPAEFAEKFPELKELIPDLDKKIEFFTRLKLLPDPSVFDTMDPVALWFATRQDLITTMDFYLMMCSGKSSPADVITLSAALYEYTRKEYFREQIRYHMRIKYGIKNEVFSILVNALYQRYTSLEFYLRLKNQDKNSIHGLLESPILKFYSLTPVLLSAISPDGRIDPNLLDYFHAEFGKVVDDRSLSGHEHDWDYARLNLVSASDLYNRLR